MKKMSAFPSLLISTICALGLITCSVGAQKLLWEYKVPAVDGIPLVSIQGFGPGSQPFYVSPTGLTVFYAYFQDGSSIAQRLIVLSSRGLLVGVVDLPTTGYDVHFIAALTPAALSICCDDGNGTALKTYRLNKATQSFVEWSSVAIGDYFDVQGPAQAHSATGITLCTSDGRIRRYSPF